LHVYNHLMSHFIDTWMRRVAILAGIVGLATCVQPNAAGQSNPRPRDTRPSADPWQYPIRLGDTRAQVDPLLGGGEVMTPEYTEYGASGVSISFRNGRVVELNFSILPWPFNTTGNFWIPSDRRVAWGLSVNDEEASFRRTLGKPARISEQGAWMECTWKKDGYVVTGSFLEGYLVSGRFSVFVSAAERQGPNTRPFGRLFWFEIYRGL
jgi:hypothetical protein